MRPWPVNIAAAGRRHLLPSSRRRMKMDPVTNFHSRERGKQVKTYEMSRPSAVPTFRNGARPFFETNRSLIGPSPGHVASPGDQWRKMSHFLESLRRCNPLLVSTGWFTDSSSLIGPSPGHVTFSRPIGNELLHFESCEDLGRSKSRVRSADQWGNVTAVGGGKFEYFE